MPLEPDLNGPLKIRGEEDNIHREGSEQQSSKSVCHSPYRSEPLVESRSCPDDMEELFLQQRKKKVNIKLDEQSTFDNIWHAYGSGCTFYDREIWGQFGSSFLKGFITLNK